MEDTITWLDNWENEINQKIKELQSKKLNELKSECEKLQSLSVKERKEKKKVIEKVINAKYKTQIDYWKNHFLSRETGEGLRVTLRSVVDLSKYLLTSCNFDYVLTAKLNQDCLEVK